MRKLASVQTIRFLEPIEGADRVELAHVLGWQCVVGKGQFHAGDACIFFEIDAFLPVRPEFEFLRKNSYRNNEYMGEGFLLKTMKFRGQLSQGLALPLSDFPELSGIAPGTDVTERLSVREWEVPERVSSSGTIIGNRPVEIPKSDEMRVQEGGEELIHAFHGLPYYISTKMDGSSHSVCIDHEGKFHVTGHNYEYADDGKSAFYELIKARGIKEKLRAYLNEKELSTITVMGEFCAPGIQKNRIGLKEPEWFIFTVMEDGRRVSLDELQCVAKTLQNPTVPIEETGDDFDVKYPTVDAVLARADGFYDKKAGRRKEGIVVRPLEYVYSPIIGGPLSIKAVSNKYLLKKDK